jgi:hypothetical protein
MEEHEEKVVHEVCGKEGKKHRVRMGYQGRFWTAGACWWCFQCEMIFAESKLEFPDKVSN